MQGLDQSREQRSEQKLADYNHLEAGRCRWLAFDVALQCVHGQAALAGKALQFVQCDGRVIPGMAFQTAFRQQQGVGPQAAGQIEAAAGFG